MKKVLLIIGIFFVFVSLASAQEAGSACCQNHNGVCEYQCCDGSPLPRQCGGLEVSGVVQGTPMYAIINDEVVQQGHSINGVTVKEITEYSVTFEKDGKIFQQSLAAPKEVSEKEKQQYRERISSDEADYRIRQRQWRNKYQSRQADAQVYKKLRAKQYEEQKEDLEFESEIQDSKDRYEGKDRKFHGNVSCHWNGWAWVGPCD